MQAMAFVGKAGTDCELLSHRTNFSQGVLQAPASFAQIAQTLQGGNATALELNQLAYTVFGLAGTTDQLQADWLEAAQAELQSRGYGLMATRDSLATANTLVQLLSKELAWLSEALSDGSHVRSLIGEVAPFSIPNPLPEGLTQHAGCSSVGLQLIAEVIRAYLLHAWEVLHDLAPGSKQQAQRLIDDRAYRDSTLTFASNTLGLLHGIVDEDYDADWDPLDGYAIGAEFPAKLNPLQDGALPNADAAYCSPFVAYISCCLPASMRTVMQFRLEPQLGLQLQLQDSFARQSGHALAWRRSGKGVWKVYAPEQPVAGGIHSHSQLSHTQGELAQAQRQVIDLSSQVTGATALSAPVSVLSAPDLPVMSLPVFLSQPQLPEIRPTLPPRSVPVLRSGSVAAALQAELAAANARAQAPAAQAGMTAQQRIANMLAQPVQPAQAPPQVQQLPKLPTPPEFKGEMGETAAHWLRTMRRFWAFNLKEYPGHEVTYAIGRLGGDAVTWFNSTLGQQYDLAGITVPTEVFIDAFTARFITPEAANNARNRLYSLRQDKLDIRVFNERFNASLTDVRTVPGTDGISHSSAVHAYLQVIKPGLRERMSMTAPDLLSQDLIELQEHAVQCAESAAQMAAYANKSHIAESALPMGTRPDTAQKRSGRQARQAGRQRSDKTNTSRGTQGQASGQPPAKRRAGPPGGHIPTSIWKHVSIPDRKAHRDGVRYIPLTPEQQRLADQEMAARRAGLSAQQPAYQQYPAQQFPAQQPYRGKGKRNRSQQQ